MGFPVVQLVENPPAIQKTPVHFWVGKMPWRSSRLSTPVFLGFPDGSDGKESFCSAGDAGSIPGSGKYLEEENGNPLQYSCLGNPMDSGTWQATVHGIAESETTEQLSNNNLTSPSLAFLIYKMCTITVPALENHENLIR